MASLFSVSTKGDCEDCLTPTRNTHIIWMETCSESDTTEHGPGHFSCRMFPLSRLIDPGVGGGAKDVMVLAAHASAHEEASGRWRGPPGLVTPRSLNPPGSWM